MQYILFITLEQYFEKTIHNQKTIVKDIFLQI